MQEINAVHQVLVKLLDGKHRTLNFPTQSVSVQALKEKIQTLTLIPPPLQLLISSSSRSPLQDCQTLNFPAGSQNGSGYFPVVVQVLLRLRGGKGGFGSLLRGAATKAGQKKTNNFDACRDMSGRRLRHVNAEKKLEEWKAESHERRLEKMAEDYIKKKAKEMAKKGSGRSKTGVNTDKYVAKYLEDSNRCKEEVHKSVRESLKGVLSSKRKATNLNESDAKKLKIWKGKRKWDDSDSDSEDSGESDAEKDEEDAVSVVIDNGSGSGSSEEANGSENGVMCVKFEEEDNSEGQNLTNLVLDQDQEMALQLGGTSSPETLKNANEVSSDPDFAGKQVFVQPTVKEVEVSPTPTNKDMPLNFDEITSPADLEVLGMDRLKLELQTRGLKCGGTLQERAARLFLLKTTPLEMLPKKLFSKK